MSCVSLVAFERVRTFFYVVVKSMLVLSLALEKCAQLMLQLLGRGGCPVWKSEHYFCEPLASDSLVRRQGVSTEEFLGALDGQQLLVVESQGCWGRRESDSQVTWQPNSMHARDGMWIRHVSLTLRPHHHPSPPPRHTRTPNQPPPPPPSSLPSPPPPPHTHPPPPSRGPYFSVVWTLLVVCSSKCLLMKNLQVCPFFSLDFAFCFQVF